MVIPILMLRDLSKQDLPLVTQWAEVTSKVLLRTWSLVQTLNLRKLCLTWIIPKKLSHRMLIVTITIPVGRRRIILSISRKRRKGSFICWIKALRSQSFYPQGMINRMMEIKMKRVLWNSQRTKDWMIWFLDRIWYKRIHLKIHLISTIRQ